MRARVAKKILRQLVAAMPTVVPKDAVIILKHDLSHDEFLQIRDLFRSGVR
jgi:hypothetical protein